MKNLINRIEALEKIIPNRLPPCSVQTAMRCYGIYISKCGLNPGSFIDTEFSFLFNDENTKHEYTCSRDQLETVEDEAELFYKMNKDAAVEYLKGQFAGYW